MASVMSLVSPEWVPVTKSKNKDRLLSILYVDDDSVLLNVGKLYLERQPDMCVTTVDCVQDAIRILKTSSFDVILSDYQMPGTDGIGFLKILQESGCTIPFILFTGKGREEVVIEAINHGATYYVQKGGSPKAQFAELEHKIREASRRRRAEAALRETELQYRTLFEHSGTAIVTFEDDLMISSVNNEFSHLTGYSKDEVEGVLHLPDIMDGGGEEKLLDLYRVLRKGSIPAISHVEVRLITKDQRIRKLTATVAIIPTTGRSIASFMGTSSEYRAEDVPGKNHEDPCGIPTTA
jgi:PAS domain S-box-containing protein